MSLKYVANFNDVVEKTDILVYLQMNAYYFSNLKQEFCFKFGLQVRKLMCYFLDSMWETVPKMYCNRYPTLLKVGPMMRKRLLPKLISNL